MSNSSVYLDGCFDLWLFGFLLVFLRLILLLVLLFICLLVIVLLFVLVGDLWIVGRMCTRLENVSAVRKDWMEFVIRNWAGFTILEGICYRFN
jgi:hypothetical protein